MQDLKNFQNFHYEKFLDRPEIEPVVLSTALLNTTALSTSTIMSPTVNSILCYENYK